MMREDIKRLKELEWEVWEIKEKIKDEEIRYKLTKLMNNISDTIEECEDYLNYIDE